MFIYDIISDVTKIFNMTNTAKTINSLSSPDPTSGVYVLQERSNR